MMSYYLWRAVSIIPILFLVSLVAFFLSRNVPQDQVLNYMRFNGTVDVMDENDAEYSEEYLRIKKLLGYDKAQFYFALLPNQFASTHFQLNQKSKNSLKEKLPSLILPKFHWYGFDNQYHNWLKKILVLDFGRSLTDGQEGSKKILRAFSWTIKLVIFSLILAFTLGIGIGLFSEKNKQNKLINYLEYILYAFYAVPIFWLATMVVVFFTTDEYGSWTNIFPSVDVIIGKKSLIDQISVLILPVLLIALHSMAYLSRQMQMSLRKEQGNPYTRTAIAKGLDQLNTLRRHNLKNALLPMITIFSAAIPSALSGSLIIEVIFNVPGIGRLLYNSINLADWNIVFGLLIIVAMITSVSYLIGDILYAKTNPKIKFQ